MARSGGDPGLDSAVEELASVVRHSVAAWQRDRAPSGFRRFGTGLAQVEQAMVGLEASVRVSVWNMQEVVHFEPASTVMELTERSRRRGLDTQLLTNRRSLELYPLLTSEIPEVRFGPARTHFLLIDGAAAIDPGPIDDFGAPTAWFTTSLDVVRRVTDIWERTWANSTPGLAPGGAPPFTPRQCYIARRMALGAKDAVVARELGVSVRTVAGDVAHLMRIVGARSRAEAMLILLGRARPTEHSLASARCETRSLHAPTAPGAPDVIEP
jgi:DNA-binding CsgD family transcriptional regulator